MSTINAERLLIQFLETLDPKKGEALAIRLYNTFGSLSEVCKARRRALERIEGMTPELITLLKSIPKLSSAMAEEQLYKRNLLSDDTFISEFLRVELGWRDTSYFIILLLNAHHRLIRWQYLFRGTNDRIAIYPREIAREAVTCKARVVITAVNQTNGMRLHLDMRDTIRQIKEPLDLLGISYFKHYVVHVNSIAETWCPFLGELLGHKCHHAGIKGFTA
jgi:DNA repair protein RadC